MSDSTTRMTRVAWGWCLVYTALVPRELRSRRREEIRSHLWESRLAGTGAWRTVRATATGMTDDLGWATGAAGRRFGRSLSTPMPYLVLAGILPVQAAFGWRLWPMSESTLDHVSVVAAAVLVLVAGLVALARRHRA